MFLLTLNDLKNVFKHCIAHYFADYTNLFCGNKNIKAIENVANDELKDW